MWFKCMIFLDNYQNERKKRKNSLQKPIIIRDGESCRLRKALVHVSRTSSLDPSITENS